MRSFSKLCNYGCHNSCHNIPFLNKGDNAKAGLNVHYKTCKYYALGAKIRILLSRYWFNYYSWGNL